MANKKSAIEELRKSERRRVFNMRRKRAMKNAIKKFKKLIIAEKFDDAKSMVPELYKAIDKAAKRGVIKKNNAIRKKSRLMHFMHKRQELAK